MNANQLVNMFVRIVMRKFMNRGIDAGIDAYARREGKGARRDDGDDKPASAQERKRAQDAQAMARKAKQGARLIRRLGRFR